MTSVGRPSVVECVCTADVGHRQADCSQNAATGRGPDVVVHTAEVGVDPAVVNKTTNTRTKQHDYMMKRCTF